MQPLSVNLRPESFLRFNRYFIPSAIVFGIAAIIIAVGSQEHHVWISVVTGALIVVQAVLNWWSSRPIVSTWDDAGIHGEIGLRKSISVVWSQVSRIDANMFALTLCMKDERAIHVDLSSMTYAQHKELIPRLLEIARSKGVEVRAA
jgi:hypothetical protein